MFKRIFFGFIYIMEILIIVLLLKEYIIIPENIKYKFFKVKKYEKEPDLTEGHDKLKLNLRKFQYADRKNNPFLTEKDKVKRHEYLRAEKEKTLPVLRGIIPNKEKPLAVLNNDIVSPGEDIGDYYVIDIYHKTVLLQSKENKENIVMLKMED